MCRGIVMRIGDGEGSRGESHGRLREFSCLGTSTVIIYFFDSTTLSMTWVLYSLHAVASLQHIFRLNGWDFLLQPGCQVQSFQRSRRAFRRLYIPQDFSSVYTLCPSSKQERFSIAREKTSPLFIHIESLPLKHIRRPVQNTLHSHHSSPLSINLILSWRRNPCTGFPWHFKPEVRHSLKLGESPSTTTGECYQLTLVIHKTRSNLYSHMQDRYTPLQAHPSPPQSQVNRLTPFLCSRMPCLWCRCRRNAIVIIISACLASWGEKNWGERRVKQNKTGEESEPQTHPPDQTPSPPTHSSNAPSPKTHDTSPHTPAPPPHHSQYNPSALAHPSSRHRN